jgi:hypothetical protein
MALAFRAADATTRERRRVNGVASLFRAAIDRARRLPQQARTRPYQGGIDVSARRKLLSVQGQTRMFYIHDTCFVSFEMVVASDRSQQEKGRDRERGARDMRERLDRNPLNLARSYVFPMA